MDVERWADTEHAVQSPHISLKDHLDHCVGCGHGEGVRILVQGRVMAAWTMAMPVRMEMR